MKKIVFLSTLFCLLAGLCNLEAAEPMRITLWKDGAPNALGNEEKDRPRINVFLPEKDRADGAAVLICPGGGYRGLAIDHEGWQFAEWFNSFGVAAIVLEYRHSGKGYGHPNPMLDARRAMRTIRQHAKEWKIDPGRIGIIGFSAGGHLASTVGTHFEPVEKPVDEIDKVDSRPDFMILCYPVVQFNATVTHKGSQHNLIGPDASEALCDYYSNEKQVSDKTPPTFIFFTDEDTVVPPENGVAFYMALRRHKIPAEMHIFQKGKHGQGLARGHHGNEIWPELCKAWMRNNGFLKQEKQP